MKRKLGVGLVLLWWGASGACADVVVERWAVAGRVQHPKTVRFESAAAQGTLMVFDLSALADGSRVYRARLVFQREGGYARGFDIVPAEGAAGNLKAAGGPLQLVGPYYRWFDATAQVAGWATGGGKTGRLLIRQAPKFDKDLSFLEIAYEGRLKDRPKQVADLKAFYRSGQVFITFREIEDLSEGKDDYPWGLLIKKGRGYNVEMLLPKDEPREVRYRVYRHDKPITAASVGEAELLAEVVPGSRFDTRQVRRIWRGEQTPSDLDESFIALRLAVEEGKPLPSGIGRYVHTVGKDGAGYYAVVTAVDGVENTVDISPANTAGPIEEKVAPPQPVLCRESVIDKGKFKYVRREYNWYVSQPLSSIPLCYDVVVGFCPERLKKPAALSINRGHSWIEEPEPAEPSPTEGLDLAHCSDSPNAFWMGINDAYNTLKGVEEGRWQCFPQRRQEALIRWLDGQFGLDSNRITVATGAWGMMEIERPDLYAYLHGWGVPEVTKGFQAWDRARAVWGGADPYADRPKEENPFWRQDYTRYILENPTKETPFFDIHRGWGAHFTEMGWPPFPRFLRAMIDTKRPFVFNWRVRDARPVIRKDQSLPAFGNCSLDDNPGVGDLHNGETFDAQINGYLVWDSQTIVDEPTRWELTAWLEDSAPLPACTVDLTPRRCREFTAKPGEKFNWTDTSVPDGKAIASGTAEADRWGLVTVKGAAVSKGKNRIGIRRPQ